MPPLKNVLLYSFFLIFSINSFSQTNQNQRIDSLKIIYEDITQADTLRLKSLLNYAYFKFMHISLDSARYYFQLQYNLAEEKGLDDWKIKALKYIGQTYEMQANFVKAEAIYAEALPIAKKLNDPILLGDIYNNLGILYQNKSAFVKAIDSYNLSLKYFEQEQSYLGIKGAAGVYGSLGVLHATQGDSSQILSYFLKQLQLSKSINLSHGIAQASIHIGGTYFDKAKYNEALEYYQQAEKIYKEINNPYGVAQVLANVAALYMNQKSYKKAKTTIQKCLNIAEPIGDQRLISNLMLNLANIYVGEGKHDKALTLLESRVIKDRENGNLKNLSLALEDIHHVNIIKGNYKKSLEAYKSFTELKDSLINETNKRALIEREYQYTFEKQALADSLEFAQKEAITNLQLEKNEATLAQQRLGLITTILGLLLVGALAYFFYQSKKRQEAEANRVKELDAFKSTFYTNITHEFRTPLTVILGMNQQIKAQPEKFLQEGTELIERNGKNLLGQINQILDLSKLETDSLQLDIIQGDIVKFLRYSTEAFQSFANSQNLSLRFFSPVEELFMDHAPESLQNILSNLISNALKFTPDGGAIKVALDISEKELNIKVEDNGIGISKKDLPHIFDRFYQVENRQEQSVNGTGIGLAYVKELVTALGGKISVSSDLNKGTIFNLIFPILRTAPINSIPKEKPTVPQLKNAEKRIDKIGAVTFIKNEALPQLLIIEDNADVVLYLKSCLEDQYQIEVAYNGRIGIEKALENIPDLIISDVMMPEKDGFEVCDILKNDERSSHIPLILLTAKADAPSKIDGLKRGADAYLSKPFDKEELLVRLEMLVERQKRMVAYFSKSSTDNSSKNNVEEVIEVEDVFIQKVNIILETNIGDEDFGLPQLCQKVGMSRSQLFRKMKALTDTAPSTYIKNYRLTKAKALLESSDINVAEAAYAVGFKDPSYFTKIFQDTFDQLPGNLKKQL